MRNGHRIKLVREGDLMAEVEVERIDEPRGWEPYLSVGDADRLDQVRAALKAGDVRLAAQLGRVYRVTPVGAA